MGLKVIVRGGSPTIRVEIEGTDTVCEVSSALNAYQALHELKPFMQALADAVPMPVAVATEAPPLRPSTVVPSLRPSKAPRGDS